MSERVIYVVRSWPRLSQTFIVNEVLALERLGVDLAIFSLVRSGETLVQPQVAGVRASVPYLQDLAGEPLSARTRAAMGVFDPVAARASCARCCSAWRDPDWPPATARSRPWRALPTRSRSLPLPRG